MRSFPSRTVPRLSVVVRSYSWLNSACPELAPCGATIKLDNGEVVVVSIAKVWVWVRQCDTSGGLFKTLISNFLGKTLYNEKSFFKNKPTAQALRMFYPEQAPELQFNDPVLSIFSNAIWHCGSTAAEAKPASRSGGARGCRRPDQSRCLVSGRSSS